MIQRIQTLLLVVVVVVSTLLLFFPFVRYETLLNTFTLKEFNKPFCGGWYYTAEVMNLLILVLAIACIFMFAQRKRQARLANVLAVLSVCLFAILVYMDPVKVDSFLAGNKQVLWPSYLPVVSAISAFLAGVFIRKDEKLVRSADRIR